MAEVRGALDVKVDLQVDFVDARQGMQDDHVGLGACEHIVVDDVAALDGLVLFGRRKALALDARHIQHVRLADDLVEVRRLVHGHAELEHLADHLAGHLERRRAHKVDAHAVQRQEAHERVRRAAVLEVAEHRDREAIHGAELLADRKHIEQRLRRVLADTVARVDDRHGRELCRLLRRADRGMTQHNHVAVAAERAHRVRERLALGHRRARRVDRHDLSTAAQHRRLKRRRRARRLFVKERRQEPAAQNVERTVALHEEAHLLRDSKERVQVVARELAHRQDVAARQRRMVERQLRRGRGAGDRIETQLVHRSHAARGAVERRARGPRRRRRHRRHRRRLGSGGRSLDRRDGTHVRAERRVRLPPAIEHDRLATHLDAVDRAAQRSCLRRRPYTGLLVVLSDAVDFGKHVCVRLLRQLEDGARVRAQARLDKVERETAVVHGLQQQTHAVVETRDRLAGRVTRLHGQVVRDRVDRECVHVLEMLPERGLVARRRQARGHRVHVAREEESVHGDVARHTQALLLRERNELHVVARAHVRDVERTAMQTREEQRRREMRAGRVGDDELVLGPVRKVRSDVRRARAVHLRLARVRHVQGAHTRSERRQLVDMLGRREQRERRVNRTRAVKRRLGGRQRRVVDDRALRTKRRKHDRREPTARGRTRIRGHGVLRERRHDGLELHEAGERARDMRRFGVDGQEVELVALAAVDSEGLDKELGVLDVRHERDRAVDGEAARAVAHGRERRRAAVLVLARQRDEQGAAALREVREQRVRRLVALLAAPVLVLGQRLEVDDGDAVLGVKVGRAGRAVQREAELVERAHGRQELLLLAVRADAQEHVVCRHAHATGEERAQVRLVLVAPEARDLARRRHLDAQDRVGAAKAREGELRHLDADIVARHVDRGVRLQVQAHHRTRRHLDRVDARDLRHEGERAGGTHIALDHLDLVVLRDELDVARARHVERRHDHARGMLDAAHRRGLEVLRRHNERRIARVDAGILDVLRDVVHDQLAVLRDGVHLNLFRALEVLGDHDRVLAVHGRRLRQVAAEVLGRVDDVHRRATEHVRRAHQHRVAEARTRAVGVLERRELLPHRLVDAEAVEHARELVAVLGVVDHLGRRAEHLDALAVQRQRNVVRHLAAHRDDHARALFHLVNVQHSLERDVLKVQAVRLVIVRRHRLGVVVDHDRLEALRTQRANRTHGAPVELDRRADAVDTRAEHHHALVVKAHVVLQRVVRRVQVVRVRWELGRDRVDLLHKRHDAQLLAAAAHGKLRARRVARNLVVREAELLRMAQQVRRDLRGPTALHGLRRRDDARQLAEEPAVNAAQLVDALDTHAVRESIRQGKDAAVRRRRQLLLNLRVVHQIVLAKAGERGIDRANGLLQTLFQRAANRHDLTDTLHAAAELGAHAHKLAQIPARNLGHHIVETRLKARTRLVRH